MSRRAPDMRREGHSVFTTDWRLRDIGRQIESVNQSAYNRGPIFTPETTIRSIISNLHPAGGIALLGEGTWDFVNYEMPDSTRNNITLMSVAPGRTIFRRTKVTARAMLHMKGTGHQVIGIRFDDDNSTGPAVKFDDNRCALINCVAEMVHQLVEVDTADWCEIVGNRIIESRDKGVLFTGRCKGGIISGNIFEDCGSNAVYLDDSTDHTVIVGNNFFDGGTISYKAPGAGIPGSSANEATDNGGDTVEIGLNNLNSILAANVTERP